MAQKSAYRLEEDHGSSDNVQEKYLTFQLGEEEYGIQITKVREIVGMMGITAVPKTDVFFKGVINLRGKIIPVIDLRLKLGMEGIEYTERSCIIVVEVRLENIEAPIGLIVDTVTEVNYIKKDEIENPLALDMKHATKFISGLAKKDDGIKMLLDINKTLNPEELARAYDAA